MTRLLSRILLGILMVPLAIAIFFSVMVPSAAEFEFPYALLCSYAAVALFVIYYWLKLWRGDIRWTARRIHATWLSALAALILGCLIGIAITYLFASINRYGSFIWDMFIIFAGLWTILLWLVFTVVLWRETPAERDERIRQCAGDVLFCPKCGYNMTGLYESRCPECGTRYTLDQLAAAQKKETIENTATASPDRTP